jgi:hypothetical protein
VVLSSSRDVKHNITPVNARDVLERVAALPVARWSYNRNGKAETTRHLSPIAEDFFEAFGLGDSEKQVAASDLAGVALAAVKGLHEVLTEKDAELADLRARNEELLARLVALEKAIAPHPDTQLARR